MTDAEKLVNTYKVICEDLINELGDYAYELYPAKSDYFHLGITESAILDAKKDIAERLLDIKEKYIELYNNAESDTEDIH